MHMSMTGKVLKNLKMTCFIIIYYNNYYSKSESFVCVCDIHEHDT